MRNYVLPLLAALCLLLGGCGAKAETGGKDTAYPYTLSAAGCFSIGGETPEGYVWTAEDDAAQPTPEGFQITLEDEPTAWVAFTLQKDVPYTDRLAVWMVNFAADKSGKVSVLYASLTEYEPAVTGGEGTAAPYALWQGGGSVELAIQSETAWPQDCDTAQLTITDAGAAEGWRRYTITPAVQTDGSDYAGTAALTLCSPAAGLQLTLTLQAGEDGLTVESHRQSAYSVEQDEGYQKYEKHFGQVKLPEDAAALEYGAESYWDGGSTDTGVVEYVWQGQRWTWSVSSAVDAGTLRWGYDADGAERRDITAADRYVSLFSFEGGSAAVWTDDAGRTCCLMGDAEDLDTIAAAVQALLTV